ncbi:MAG: M20/M25/M40 family metallo-hydrolase [Deltaproteobacteria bacterium]|nr:M20/M25/M40 family metallo-hydrolase [Deltaproteobacteria bacterium]
MRLQTEWQDLAVGLLKDLIRIDTSNPPGNEEPACEVAAEALAAHGVEPRLFRPAPGRANLTARVRGDGSLPPLLLAAHLDVVPAEPAAWTHPPFSAAEADGCIWGRGALDMKHMAAMATAVLCRLGRERPAMRRDVILALVADEEVGMELGSRWLVDHEPDEVRAGVALGEIGGISMGLAGRRLYPLQVAEKGIAWLLLTAHGAAGHGSIPDPESATVRLARAVAALGETPLPPHPTPAARAFAAAALDALRPGLRIAAPLLAGDAGARLLRRAGRKSAIGRAVGAMLANTAAPTCLRAGSSTNVIPAEATAEVDGRTLPGQTAGDLVREVRAIVGDGVEIAVRQEAPPVSAPLDHPFVSLARRVLAAHDAEGRLVPALTPGFTDAKSWSRLGAACYGFTPVRLPEGFPAFSTLIHGVDERIPIEGFRWGVGVLADLVESWAAQEHAP